jgi:hypothetical protein
VVVQPTYDILWLLDWSGGGLANTQNGLLVLHIDPAGNLSDDDVCRHCLSPMPAWVEKS